MRKINVNGITKNIVVATIDDMAIGLSALGVIAFAYIAAVDLTHKGHRTDGVAGLIISAAFAKSTYNNLVARARKKPADICIETEDDLEDIEVDEI